MKDEHQQLSRSDINLMAPAGSYESLAAAIQAGANSVYFGVERLNMRARSSANFTLADMGQIAKICQENGMERYLTLNTVLFDSEIADMHRIVEAAKAAGVTAIIASDQSVINFANEAGVEVHISTQLNVSNLETLKFYAKFAPVIVLARELNLNQVKYIHEQIAAQNIRGPRGNPVKIEMFCHGALCVATSGKCYMSLHESGFSANRGSCLQICRRSYLVTEKETGSELEIDHDYIMSPKDLCTIGFLDKMLQSGVRVFKVEGRARSADYVKKVCQCYNEAFEAIIEDSYSKDKIDKWISELSTVFNRGFWDGYYLGQRLGEWSKSYGSKATRRKIYSAKATNYFSNLGVAEFMVESGSIKTGADVMSIGPTPGVMELRVSQLRVDSGAAVQQVFKGPVFSMPVSGKVRRADRLYLLEQIKK
ncbi:MAG: U32 family peptidase [Prevotellaceae bacterium]|jgi:putative protease|nr:U32 family peptidase [Prevotellaceae bacterium]